MSRGDVVIVAASGDYGKPRPAVIVQSDAVPGSHASVVICPMTSETAEADFRITISRAGNGAAGRISDDGGQTRNDPS
jgi:mRNA interferase MazF